MYSTVPLKSLLALFMSAIQNSRSLERPCSSWITCELAHTGIRTEDTYIRDFSQKCLLKILFSERTTQKQCFQISTRRKRQGYSVFIEISYFLGLGSGSPLPGREKLLVLVEYVVCCFLVYNMLLYFELILLRLWCLIMNKFRMLFHDIRRNVQFFPERSCLGYCNVLK